MRKPWRWLQGLAATATAVVLTALTAELHAQTLQLNEVVTSNTSGLEDQDGERPDWIELFNPGTATLNLAGYGLSDDLRQPFKWRFPARLLPARSHLLLFASGRNITNTQPLHTNFRLSAAGDTLVLTRPDGRTADLVQLPALRANLAFGRQPGATSNWVFLSSPTPAAPNQPPFASSWLPEPLFSRTGGTHDDAFDLHLTPPLPDAEVRFTLDGSEPTPTSTPALGPIRIGDRSSEPNGISLISGTATNNQHTDGWKPPVGPVAKVTVVRARAFRAGSLPSRGVSETYIPTKLAALNLPILSIAMDPADLFDHTNGIYMLGKVFEDWRTAHPGEALTGHTPANYTQRGDAWERPASLQAFAPDGTAIFSRAVSVDIQGQSSRSFRQKSLGLKTTDEPIRHPLFPGLARRGNGLPLEEFSRVRLRNGGNDWALAFLRDALCHELVRELMLDRQAYAPSVLFLNGEFWGYYELREQHDSRFLAAHYGLSPADAVICGGSGNLEEGPTGANLPFLALRSHMTAGNLDDAGRFAEVERQMDIENFILYNAAGIYFGNADWPHNNVRVWRNHRADPKSGSPTQPLDGRWRWLLFDCDLTFAHPWSGGMSYDALAVSLSPTGAPGLGTDAGWSTVMLRSLIANPGFKQRFLSRSADLLNSHFREDRVRETLLSMQSAMGPVMQQHLDRWRTLEDTNAWLAQVRVLTNFAFQRPILVRQQYVKAFHLEGYAPVVLDVGPAGAGTIQVNSLHITPQLPGAGPRPYPWRGYYFRGLPIDLEARPAPGWEFVRWEQRKPELAPPGPSARASLVVRDTTELTALFRPIPPRFTSIVPGPANTWVLQFLAPPNRSCSVTGSTNLNHWTLLRTLTTSATGTNSLSIARSPNAGSLFLRLQLSLE